MGLFVKVYGLTDVFRGGLGAGSARGIYWGVYRGAEGCVVEVTRSGKVRQVGRWTGGPAQRDCFPLVGRAGSGVSVRGRSYVVFDPNRATHGRWAPSATELLRKSHHLECDLHHYVIPVVRVRSCQGPALREPPTKTRSRSSDSPPHLLASSPPIHTPNSHYAPCSPYTSSGGRVDGSSHPQTE